MAWAILHAFIELSATSVLYSITGLIIAIAGIITGFKLSYRSIRVFGLVLAIVMVAKFILVDLHGENSMMRVVSLIIGGGLCFMISWTYNKLSEKKDGL